MAKIKREYRCFAHGFFEGTQPICPYGCDTAIERAFLTAPALSSPRTRNIDRTLAALAKDYGLTDMTNRRGNGSVGDGLPRNDLSGNWAQLGKNVEHPQLAQSKASEQAIAQFAAQRKLAPVPDVSQGVHNLPPVKPMVDPRHRYGDATALKAAVKRAV